MSSNINRAIYKYIYYRTITRNNDSFDDYIGDSDDKLLTLRVRNARNVR